MDTGVEKVADPQQARAAREQARGVAVKSIALAVVLTALAYWLPAF
jgi:hypothetical protein